MTLEEFNTWKNHPATRFMEAFFKDHAAFEYENLGRVCFNCTPVEGAYRSGVIKGLEQAWDLDNLFGDFINARSGGTQAEDQAD